MTHTVASSHGRTYGSSAPDESMSTTGVSIATVRCTAVIFFGIVASSRSTGNEWVSRLSSYYTKVPRSLPARAGWSSAGLSPLGPSQLSSLKVRLSRMFWAMKVTARPHFRGLVRPDYRMAPGLRIPSGSSAFLILCERAITSGPS